jgi:predicted RNase H-like nuclease (RuvC/YqgF family)
LADLSDINRKLSDYESKITMLKQEVDRLNGALRGKMDDNANLENRLRQSINES